MYYEFITFFFKPSAFIKHISFSQRKTEKKKADKPCGRSGKPKGNGISPARVARQEPLCRSLLVYHRELRPQ